MFLKNYVPWLEKNNIFSGNISFYPQVPIFCDKHLVTNIWFSCTHLINQKRNLWNCFLRNISFSTPRWKFLQKFMITWLCVEDELFTPYFYSFLADFYSLFITPYSLFFYHCLFFIAVAWKWVVVSAICFLFLFNLKRTIKHAETWKKLNKIKQYSNGVWMVEKIYCIHGRVTEISSTQYLHAKFYLLIHSVTLKI